MAVINQIFIAPYYRPPDKQAERYPLTIEVMCYEKVDVNMKLCRFFVQHQTSAYSFSG